MRWEGIHALAPHRVREWSLATRMSLSVVAVVAAVSVLLSLLMASAVGSVLTGRLDDDLAAAHARAVGALERGIPALPPPRPDGVPAPPEIREARGQQAGTLTAYFVDGVGEGERITAEGDLAQVPNKVLSALAAESGAEGGRTVDLTEWGEHRMLATQVGEVSVVTALPTAEVSQTVARLVAWSLAFGALAIAAAGGVAAVVARRQVRGLRDVALTARAVTATDLSSGEVEVPRVDPPLLTSGDEVGQVARALDAVLGHVGEALDVRHRSEQQVRQFVADASHELRTPLATVRGYAELALRPDADDATRVRSLDKVRTEAERMGRLVEDLLLLARLDQGRPLEVGEVDLTVMVLETVSDAQVTAPAHQWRIELPDDPVTVTGDADRLRQVLINLVSNAARHTPEGTTVTVALTRRGEAVEASVTDDGAGIEPGLLGEVFTRFVRGDSARTREASGAGLGLALASSIAQAHGGALTVTSRPGATRFALSLPRSPLAPVHVVGCG